METLKKKPSKSILVSSSERQSQRLQEIKKISDGVGTEMLVPNVTTDTGVNSSYSNMSNNGLGSGEIELNRRSAVSIKSVTFNEKTQIRRITKAKH